MRTSRRYRFHVADWPNLDNGVIGTQAYNDAVVNKVVRIHLRGGLQGADTKI